MKHKFNAMMLAGAVFIVAGTLAVSLHMTAHAQLFTYTATTTNTSTNALSTTTSLSSNPSTTTGTMTPSGTEASTSTSVAPVYLVSPAQPITPPSSEVGFIQFDNLVITSVSSNDVPGTITATENLGSQAASSSSGMVTFPGPCYQFISADATLGTPVTCPATPQTFAIGATTNTQLLLRNRTTAVLANMTPGDIINVYGFYDGTGMFQASIIRDLSKPAGPETPTADWQNNVLSMFNGASNVTATVIGVNGDGSLILQFSDGQNVNVPSLIPIDTVVNFTNGAATGGNLGISFTMPTTAFGSGTNPGGPMIPYSTSSTSYYSSSTYIVPTSPSTTQQQQMMSNLSSSTSSSTASSSDETGTTD